MARWLAAVACAAVLSSCGGSKSLWWNSEGLFPIREGGRIGFIDRTGKVAIAPQFEDPTVEWQFLDDIRLHRYAAMYLLLHLGAFSEGLCAVRVGNNRWAWVDRTGRAVIGPMNLRAAGPFSEGLAPATKPDGEFTHINRRGEFLPLRGLKGGLDFHDGLAGVMADGEKWGYIDRSGKFVISPRFDSAQGFSDGLAAVRDGEKWGFIDRGGRFQIAAQFEDAWPLSEGLAAVRTGGKRGYIDRSGRFVIQPQYEEADNFHEGLAAVKTADGWGYTDKTGRQVITAQLRDAGPFLSGLAVVRRNGEELYGHIDRSGRFAIQPQFEFAWPFLPDGVAPVVVDASRGWRFKDVQIGYIDRSGAYIWKPGPR